MNTLASFKKLGRNDPCFCGSGIKFKKCCLGKKEKSSLELVSNNEPLHGLENQKVIIQTTTEEFQMPIRLYYKIIDMKALLQKLQELKCVSGQEGSQFCINYHEEVQDIGLSVKPHGVPRELYPITLAEGTIVSNKELHLDLRAFLRAIGLVKFIDAHIGKSIMRLTHFASCNFIEEKTREEIRKAMIIDFDEIFSEKNMVIYDKKAKIKELNEMAVSSRTAKSEEERENISRTFLEKMEQDMVPLIEKVPVSPYKDGIRRLEFSLMIRMTCAVDRHMGKDTTVLGAIRTLLGD